MAIYHVERTVVVSQEYIEVWEVESNSEEEAVDVAITQGTLLSTEMVDESITEDRITGVYKVSE